VKSPSISGDLLLVVAKSVLETLGFEGEYPNGL
jgi:hypothetical protein